MGSDCSCKCHTKTSTRKQADSRYDPKDDPMSWQHDKAAHPGAPTSGVPKDLFPEGGVPLRGELTPEQEAWLKSRGSRKQADMFGNSDEPHNVAQPDVATALVPPRAPPRATRTA